MEIRILLAITGTVAACGGRGALSPLRKCTMTLATPHTVEAISSLQTRLNTRPLEIFIDTCAMHGERGGLRLQLRHVEQPTGSLRPIWSFSREAMFGADEEAPDFSPRLGPSFRAAVVAPSKYKFGSIKICVCAYVPACLFWGEQFGSTAICLLVQGSYMYYL